MAQQGSGLGKGPDGNSMQDQTSMNGRSGGQAKRTQTNFPVHPAMKDPDGNDDTNENVGPSNPGTGPDASSSNPLDPTVRGKTVQSTFPAKWDMKDANGKGVDHNIGGKVIGEAILSGASKL